MRAVVDLHSVDLRVASADEMLARTHDHTVVHAALARLEEVDGLLADLLADENLTPDMAARLGRIRDDLCSHLLAATAMGDLDLPAETVVGVLRRSVSAARSAIEAIETVSASA